MTTIKQTVTLPVYSGHPRHPRGTSYSKGGVQAREEYSVKEWCIAITETSTAARVAWTPEVTASQVVLVLVPGSPAYIWHRVARDREDITTWPKLRKAIIKEFTPVMTPADQIDILNTFHQGKNELVANFKNRLDMNFKEFVTTCIEPALTGPKFADQSAALAERQKDTMEASMGAVSKALFFKGIKADLQAEII